MISFKTKKCTFYIRYVVKKDVFINWFCLHADETLQCEKSCLFNIVNCIVTCKKQIKDKKKDIQGR